MIRTLSLGFVALFSVFFAGCSTVESRIQANPQIYASLAAGDQALIRQGRIREGMLQAGVFLAWGRPDRARFGNRSGRSYETWTYTTTRTDTVTGYYPAFYRFGPYPYFGIWPYSPFVDDVVAYEVPYKRAFFEGGRCTGWEYIR